MPISNQEFFIQRLIYSYLAHSADFIAVWQTNKTLQQEIEQALFSKTDTHFYPAQCYVLSTLFCMKTTLEIDQRLHHLAQLFLLKLTNPDLTLIEIFSGLNLLAAIYQVPLDITLITQQLEANPNQALACLSTIAPALTPKKTLELLVVPLIAKLYDKDLLVRQSAEVDLTAIVPNLETITLVNLTCVVLDRLDDKYPYDNGTISNLLMAIVLRLNTTTLVKLIPSILVKLDNDNPVFLRKASTFLTAMIPRLDDANLTILINFIVAKLNHSSHYIVEAALTCLIAMVPRLDDNRVVSLIEPIFMMLEDHHKTNDVPRKVIQCLSVMVPKLNDGTLALWTKPILVKLDSRFNNSGHDGGYYINRAALNCLTAMTLRLNDIYLLSQIHSIFIKPYDIESNYISEKAILNCLTAMVTKLNTKTLVLWINSILAKLDEWNNDIFKEASTCLIAMVPRLDKENQTRLINPILAKINDNNHRVHCHALKCLAVIVPILDTTTVVLLVNSILAILDNSNSRIYYLTLEYLTMIVPIECLTRMVPILDTTTMMLWVDPILAELCSGYPCDRKALLSCLEAMVPKLNSAILISLIEFILENLEPRELMPLLTVIVSQLFQLEVSLSADLITLLVSKLSYRNYDLAKRCFKLSLHLSVYCHKKLFVNNVDNLSEVLKDNQFSVENPPTDMFLLAHIVYPWLAQIVTRSQQSMAHLTNTDSTSLVTSRQPDSIDAGTQPISPQRTQIIQQLTTYIARINSYKDGFTHGFWVAKTSRAINREINIMLAEELVIRLKEKTKNTMDLFSSDAIKALRQQIIKNYALDKRVGYVERPIGSCELNHIIREVQNIEFQPLESIGCCG
jgi:hypothetical protein